jgi:hypothetical protein
MSEIIVKTQQEFDNIPDEFKGYIYIQSEPDSRIIIAKRKGIIVAWGNSSVVARENSSVEAWGNSSVEAWGNSSVVARENSSVEAWGNSSVVARENSSVEAWENSSVEARENSSVVARENSSVEAWGNSSVVARENSSVEAMVNSSVVARENSSVEALENSSVEAWGNSSVVAWGNCQTVKRSNFCKIDTHGNARIVEMPKDIHQFLDFYGIEERGGFVILYKSVGENLSSFHDNSFVYEIGGKHTHKCDPDVNRDCSTGLHISHKAWAIQFGKKYKNFKLLECKVPVDKIVLPTSSDGKVRTSELEVIREVPIEEWGVYGKIIKKQLANK